MAADDTPGRTEKLRPGKKHFRCHAHTNPFRDQNIEIPASPHSVDWSAHYRDGRAPSVLDIGCGYGRFLLAAAGLCPADNILGLEIRDKVVDYVRLLTQSVANCSVVKTNALLFLVNFIGPSSLTRIFVLFPDPHFKKRKQKARIVCRETVGIFRYLLRERGEIYVSTDVEGLFGGMCAVLGESGAFEAVEECDGEQGRLLEMARNDTDEAHRAGAKAGRTFGRVYRVKK